MAGLKEVVRGVVDLARGSTPPVETLQSVENPKLRQFLEAVEPQIKSITSWPFPGNRLADEFGDVLGRPRPRGRDADVYKWYNAVTGNGIIDFNYVPLGKSIRYSLTPDMLRAFAGFCWSYREWSEYSIGLGERIVRLREAFGEHPLGKLLNDPLKKSVGKPDEPAAQSPVEPAPVALLGDTGVFDGVADEAILAEPVTVEEEPVVAVVEEDDGLREEIAAIADGGLREYLAGVYEKASQIMRERGAEWPIPGPWTYKFFQEALGASYGEILDFYRKVAANKYVTFGPYKAGKTGAYMMDLPAFLAFVALLEILPSVLGASGRPDWKAAVSRTKNMLGQLHVIADKLMVPVIEPLPKPRPEPPIDEPKESPLPAVFQSDEMISPPQPPESVTAKILGQEVNLTELSRKIEPSSEEISPQKLGQLLGVEDERDAVDMAWELVERAGGSRRGGLTEERLSAVVWKVIQKGRK